MINTKKILFKKLWYTMLIISVYLLGQNITLPNVKVFNNLLEDQVSGNILDAVSTMTGGGLTSLSIFSLGLGPWMTTLILWRVFITINKTKYEDMSKKKMDRYMYTIAFVISLLQALVILKAYEFTDTGIELYGTTFLRITTILFLVSGTFFIIWLANINAENGIGGMMIMLVVNMVSSWGNIIVKLSQGQFTADENQKRILLLILLFSIVGVLITIILENSEYRIPLIRILVDNKFSKNTYVPIKLNPTGGLAFMYGMSFMLLPRYLFIGLNSIVPNNEYIMWAIANITITRLPGIILYLLIIFFLSIGFGFMNLDVEKITEEYQKRGDYLRDIRPGYSTEKYLYKRVTVIVVCASLYVTLFMGFPFIFLIFDPTALNLIMVPGILMILTSITLNYTVEFDILKLTKKYNNKLF